MKNLDHNSALYKACLLGILCAVCGLLLSVVNGITAPLIAENQLATVKASLEEIYPGASFTDRTSELIELDETGLIDGIYEAEGKGYIFTLHGTGYNANGFTFMVGFGNDGKISGYTALEQQETSGVGSRAFEDDYVNTITSLSSSDPIPLLSGATLTSTAVAEGIDAAKAVFNSVQGISYDPDAKADGASGAGGTAAAGALVSEDYSANNVTCSVWDNTDPKNTAYKCSAKGFEGTNEALIYINTETGTVNAIEILSFGDTAGVGDAATGEAELARYKDAGLDSVIDSTSGASYTSKSIRAMAAAALEMATGK